MRRRSIALLTSALGLLIPGRNDPAPTFPALVVRELAALHPGTTPAAWLRAHPADSLVRFDREIDSEHDQRWCARAVSRIALVDGRFAVRYAYFYPPAPGPSLSLPAGEDPQLILERCRLGAIWVETPVGDQASGDALAAGMREALTRVYGPVRPAPDPWYGRALADSSRRTALARLPPEHAEIFRLGLHFLGAAHWRGPGRWQLDSAVVATAYDREPTGSRALACAFLPFAGLGTIPIEADDEPAADRKAAAFAVRAARLSGVDPRRVGRLLAVLAAAESAWVSDPPDRRRERVRVVDTLMISALGDWVAASRGLDASHRAAAFLAADQVMGSNAVSFILAQDSAGPTRQALAGLGVQFIHSELGGSENYTHSWLDEAWRLDSVGQAGRLATLALLRLGFNKTGMCDGGAEPFRRVSTAGEELLRSLSDSAMAAEVHLLVADGYADVVGLAAGGGLEYADTSAYTAAAPEARHRAIRHYRLGIALEPAPPSPDARAAWLTAWRLLAGLPPERLRFFCVYD